MVPVGRPLFHFVTGKKSFLKLIETLDYSIDHTVNCNGTIFKIPAAKNNTQIQGWKIKNGKAVRQSDPHNYSDNLSAEDAAKIRREKLRLNIRATRFDAFGLVESNP